MIISADIPIVEYLLFVIILNKEVFEKLFCVYPMIINHKILFISIIQVCKNLYKAESFYW
jgi:hypothetical protein